MKKQETIVIAGREIIISEISVSRVYKLLQGEESIINLPFAQIAEQVKSLLPLAIDISVDELIQLDIFSDDIDLLVEAFKRTNPFFFDLARTLNLGGVLADVIRLLLTNFSTAFVGSSLPDMPVPGSMESDSLPTA